MPIRIARSAFVVLPVLAGCSELPPFNSLGAVRSTEIIHHVQCELRDAYENLGGEQLWLKNWAAAYTLTYKAEVQNSGGVTPATWTIPGGPVIGASAVATQGGTRQGLIKYQSDLSAIKPIGCLPIVDEPASAGFRGNLGIGEWLHQALAPNKGKADGPKELSYSVTFLAKTDSSLKPVFSIMNFSAGATAGRVRTDTDMLNIAFVEVPKKPVPPPVKAIPVYIVPAPGKPQASTVMPQETPSLGTPELSDETRRRLDNLLNGSSNILLNPQ